MSSGAARSVTEAIRTRHSCRAFTAQPVPESVLRQLLETARFAPSGGNLQPWAVHVLFGESMSRFRAMLAPKVAAAPLGGPAEYNIYPPSLGEPYRTRRFQVGEDLYAAIGVAREDKPGRIRQFARNYDFFGAPAAMFFFVDRQMGPPQWADIGMLLQNIMLLAREHGLDTCPQEAWASWHGEVAQFLGAPPQLMLFCGMSIGHADPSAPINELRSRRAPVEEFAKFHD
jgi:nitroreductase